MSDWQAVAEKICDALGGETTRRGWDVRCPVHDDHEPSLQMEIKNDHLLLKCRVGCDQQDIIEALRALELWPKKSDKPMKRLIDPDNLVASYRYINPHTGEIQAVKERYEATVDGKRKKTFQWVQPDGTDGLGSGGQGSLYLYNAGTLINHTDAIVLVVEGEKVVDKLSFILDADEFVAVSLPGGADATWEDQNIALVTGGTVIMLPDEDDSGYKLLGRTLGALAGECTVSWLKLPGLGPKEDAADWFDAGHTVDEFREAVQRLSKSEKPTEAETPKFDGTLPHNLEAEQIILGAVLIAQQSAYESVRLSTEQFYVEAHKILWEALSELYAADKGLGLNTVRDHLAGRDLLKKVGGTAYLQTLESQGRTHYADFLDEQASLVRKSAVQRQLITAGEHVSAIGWDGKLDAEDAVQAAYEQVVTVATNHGSTDFVDMPGLMQNVSDILERQAQNQDLITGIPTGFPRLDLATSGLQEGDLVVLAARPSMGKTALALNIAHHAGMKGHNVAVFSVEMSREQIGKRLVTVEGMIPHQMIRTGKIEREYEKGVRAALDRLSQRPIYVDDTATTVLAMKAKAQRLKRERGLGLVIVDYMQLMDGSAQSRKFGKVAEVTEISKGLKRLARELQVPVLALSQLSRAPEQRTDKRPMMSDLRDSGAVEQDADLVLFLYRDEYYNPLDSNHPTDSPGVVELDLQKHRNGPTPKFWLRFEETTMTFSSMAHNDPVFDQEDAA